MSVAAFENRRYKTQVSERPSAKSIRDIANLMRTLGFTLKMKILQTQIGFGSRLFEATDTQGETTHDGGNEDGLTKEQRAEKEKALWEERMRRVQESKNKSDTKSPTSPEKVTSD